MGDTELASNVTAYLATKCQCINDCYNADSIESICHLEPKAKCFKKWEQTDEGDWLESAGCLSSIDTHLDQCSLGSISTSKFQKRTEFKCCWDGDMCNRDLTFDPPAPVEEPAKTDFSSTTVLIIAIVAALIVILSTFLIGRMIFRNRKRRRKRHIDEESDTCGINSKNIDELVAEYSTPCSSGSGMPLLVQRTIAKQIEIIRELGRGRYGTVMLGKWRDEYVAVKSFHSTEEKSWARETEIYQTVQLRHENILCFVASDINGNGSWTELYLITAYHPNGSLHDYLQNRSLDLPSALKLAQSAACGLAHLHTEIIGTQGKIANQGKEAIAHRDIKSKNILVRADGACCIADMGLAVIYSSSKEDRKGRLDKGHYTRGMQGTKRYMSPEILSGKLDEESFDAFKASDVYSFALVLWEVLNCTSVKGYDGFRKYRVPYYDVVGNDPDFDEMRKVVDIDGIRPEVNPCHSKHEVLSRYVKMMCECWVARPESRLTMLRVRKTLGTLQHGHDEEAPPVIMDYQPSNASSIYISDRSNSSGFPTESTYDQMKWKTDNNGSVNGFLDKTSGYDFLPNPENVDTRLIRTGFTKGS